MRRRLQVALHAVVLIATVTWFGASKADARHFMQAPQVVQFNVFGYQGGGGFNSNVGSDVVNSILSRNPMPSFLSLNEICVEQLNQIMAAVGPYGYMAIQTSTRAINGYSWPGVPQTAFADCQKFGSAVIWLGGGTGVITAGWFNNNPNANVERRAWACAQSTFFSAYWWACTAHMDTSDATARSQADEYFQAVENQRLTGQTVHAAGDFNFDGRTSGTLNYTNLDKWYSAYCEADNTANSRSSSVQTMNNSNEKMDYIFRANPATSAHDAYLFNTANSDHRWLQMYIN